MVASRSTLTAGVLWALAAGLMWGLAFVAPLVLAGYHAVEVTAGRYAAYGLFALAALAVAATQGPIAGIRDRRVWAQAFGLTLLGNLVYFACLTAGIQFAGAPIAALIIGMLPVLLPIAAGLSERRSARLGALVGPSLVMLAGLVAVHLGDGKSLLTAGTQPDYWTGIGLIVAALLAWTWYGVANAHALRRRPGITAATWASLQGITLLPIALPVLAFSGFVGATHPAMRPSWFTFAAVSLVLGIATSWIATWCWTRASQLLPATLAGQLIVFETLAALVYAYAWTLSLPPTLVVIGSALLIGGVILGIRRLGDPT
jgi:drug/metabolite transporter (DMT)-like permease